MEKLTNYIKESILCESNDPVKDFMKKHQKQLEVFHKETIKDKYAIFNGILTVEDKNIDVQLYGTFIDRSFDRKPSVYQVCFRDDNSVLIEKRTLSLKDIINALSEYIEDKVEALK